MMEEARAIADKAANMGMHDDPVAADAYLFHFLGNIGTQGIPKIYIYGLFLFSIVYSTTEQMNLNPKALFFEGIKSIFGISIWLYYGSWFHTFELMSFQGFFVISYLFLSFLITWNLFSKNQTNPFEAIP
jgi:hypothetical protein